MIHEDWDEGYEPPESDTYAGGSAEGEVCHRTVCDERCGYPSCMGPEVTPFNTEVANAFSLARVALAHSIPEPKFQVFHRQAIEAIDKLIPELK